MRPVTLLTDFGYEDEFAGVCRAVIIGVDPELRIIDVSHGIPAGDVLRGALALAAFVRFSPPAVHLAIVDPGVGTRRRAVAIKVGDHLLVGPDNGLLTLAATVLGGPERAAEISSERFRSDEPARTFHGRDLFAPVAAELARGTALTTIGDEIEVESLIEVDLPHPEMAADRIEVTALYGDRFGNLVFNLDRYGLEGSFLAADGEARIVLPGGDSLELPFLPVFGEVEPGGPLLFTDSNGWLSLAINQGDAAAAYGLGPGDRVLIEPVGLA